MQLRYLKNVSLKKANSTKQENGVYVDCYILVKNYKVQFEELTDMVNATIYGANVSKVKKIKSPRNELEKYLSSILNNNEDNISKYFVCFDNGIYKINDANMSGITIERI